MMLEPLTATYLILASSWCQPPRAPELEVSVDVRPIKMVYSKSSDDLKKFQIDTVNPYGNEVSTKIGGLTRGQINVNQRVTIGGAQRGAETCFWYETVKVIVQMDPTVYIAKEYPFGTCAHKAIREHENKHVKVDYNMIVRYRAVYEKALKKTLLDNWIHGPYQVGVKQEDVQTVMMGKISDVAGYVTKKLETERGRAQQAIDSREEYDHVAGQCPETARR
jgi:hypothetical protein